MKRITFICLLAMLAHFKVFCQVSSSYYTITSLPDSLKKNANAVYRLDERILDVTSDSKYTYTTHQVITLLNKDGGYHLDQSFYFDKFRKIDDVVFKVYDSEGSLLKTYQKKVFNTRNYLDDVSFYTDDKILYLGAASPGYPCIVEITAKIKATGYIELPDWIIATPKESVENSSFVVKVPPSLTIRYRSVNSDIKPVIENTGEGKTYTWTAKNIIASEPEPYSYTSHNLPKIEVVPDRFQYDGYKGELKSWQAFGAWNYQFYDDPKSFTLQDIEKFRYMVSTCKTDRDKIKTLYNYLKQSMRYVSVQLGIGGFRPFPVEYVNDKKYGDCKALTNYMRYMLKAVGINSYPALINALYNSKPVDANFPSDPFNHVILCVPLAKDSVWLECTSNYNEYGFLGSFTEDKYALLLTEKGGVLVPTPKSNENNNILSTKTVVVLNEDGGSKVSSDIYYTGDFRGIFYYILKQDQDREKSLFITDLQYKIPEQFKLDEKPDSADGKKITLALTYDQQYDFKTGSKLFFKPGINALSDEDVPLKERKSDYIFEFPYTKVDTTVYILPKSISIEKLPLKRETENEYGAYKNEYFHNEIEHTITLVSKLELKKRMLPSADYVKVATFFQYVKKIENEKFILKMN